MTSSVVQLFKVIDTRSNYCNNTRKLSIIVNMKWDASEKTVAQLK